jgi:hypothetical protein
MPSRFFTNMHEMPYFAESNAPSGTRRKHPKTSPRGVDDTRSRPTTRARRHPRGAGGGLLQHLIGQLRQIIGQLVSAHQQLADRGHSAEIWEL